MQSERNSNLKVRNQQNNTKKNKFGPQNYRVCQISIGWTFDVLLRVKRICLSD